MITRRLSWDSNFFGAEIGEIRVLRSDYGDDIRVSCAIRELGCELAYVFLPVERDEGGGVERIRKSLVGVGGRLMDVKIVLKKTISELKFQDAGGGICATGGEDGLKDLAVSSGWCSRFFCDEKLRVRFRALYEKWLEKDLRSGKVFVRMNSGRCVGMVTVSVCDGVGRIGLVAVDVEHCCRGIATGLMRDAERWLLTQGVKECVVVTQGANSAGLALYKKCGFTVDSRAEVWHVWQQ